MPLGRLSVARENGPATFVEPSRNGRYIVARLDRAPKDDLGIPDGLAAENVYGSEPPPYDDSEELLRRDQPRPISGGASHRRRQGAPRAAGNCDRRAGRGAVRDRRGGGETTRAGEG